PTGNTASLEGILAEPPPSSWPAGPTSPPANISHVTIAGNVAVHNDKAYDTSLPPESACPSSTTDADDCGEGIHLIAATWSKVILNKVSHNVGDPPERRRLRDLGRARSAQPDRLQPFHGQCIRLRGPPAWPRPPRGGHDRSERRPASAQPGGGV